MRTFSGGGGSLYALGERLAFRDIPLDDCGDGWDWRAPEDVSYWLTEDPVELRAYIRGEWISFQPAEIFHQSGRVGFPRNITGATVLASGSCLPITKISESQRWELHQIASAGEGGDPAQPTRVMGMEALLHEVDGVPISDVLVRLPTTGDGVFIGVGEAHQMGPDIHINFNQEGVSFVLR